MFLHQHLDLLARDRTFALRQVVGRVVRPGDRVLDAGTGSGLLAVWAAMAGAREVVAVDLEHSRVAKALAERNGVADRIRVVTGDLRHVALDGRFDVTTALVYLNDPRRDQDAHGLVADLVDRWLAPDGRLVPDRVRYRVWGLDWAAQDVTTHHQRTRELCRALSEQHGTDLRVIGELLEDEVPRTLFPPRGPDGRVDRTGARALTEAATVLDLRYLERARPAWPEALTLQPVAPGVLTTVLFAQELMWGDTLLFRNESVAWLSEPVRTEPGSAVTLPLDGRWRRTNTFGPAR